MNKKFIWLNDSCFARNGKKLTKNESYSIQDFSAGVVTEWIKTGAAKLSKLENKKSEVN